MISNNPEQNQKIQKAHDEAVDKGENSYLDPLSGFSVFTSEYHRQRGFCCESGCRHCPYGFEKKSSFGISGKKKS